MCRAKSQGGRRCAGCTGEARNAKDRARRAARRLAEQHGGHAPSEWTTATVAAEVDGLKPKAAEARLHDLLDTATDPGVLRAIGAWVIDSALSRAAQTRVDDHVALARENLRDGKRVPYVDPVAAKRAAEARRKDARQSAWDATDIDAAEAFSTRPLVEMGTGSGLGRMLADALRSPESNRDWQVVHRRDLSDGTVVAAVALSERHMARAEREWGGIEDLSGVALVSPDGSIEFSVGQYGIVSMADQQARNLEALFAHRKAVS